MTGSQPSTPNTAAPRGFDILARSASGAVLAIAAIAALVAGGVAFSLIVAAGSIAALREWHRLVSGRVSREMIVTGLAVIAVIWLGAERAGLPLAGAAILAGIVGAALSASLRRDSVYALVPWHAFGALYVGLSAWALIALRNEPRGAAIVGGVFVAVWSADTGALFVGRLIGGPKLAPVLSPNKTWAGFLGGTIVAAAAEAIYVGVLGGNVFTGAAFGILLALAGHCGDLFESWVKRQFHAKNTGHLIPGHGGMLDRIDSLLFAVPVCAALTFFFGLNPLVAGGA